MAAPLEGSRIIARRCFTAQGVHNISHICLRCLSTTPRLSMPKSPQLVAYQKMQQKLRSSANPEERELSRRIEVANVARQEAQLENDTFKLEMYASRKKEMSLNDSKGLDDDEDEDSRQRSRGKSRDKFENAMPASKDGLLNLSEEPQPHGDVDPLRLGFDEITSAGQHSMEQHREFRHYARLAAWEMPLLTKFAKPFEPPSAMEPLRFRYTTYMGESHPAQNKVVLEFCTADMPDLTKQQREKLVKLVGVRYNPDTDIVKMSCEMFETQAKNKRYLGDLVDNLLTEARDPVETFADVPFDFRHHKRRPTYDFPEEWKLNPQRTAQLNGWFTDMHQRDQKLMEGGKMVDGLRLIQAANEKRDHALSQQPAPAMAMAMAGRQKGKGKGKGKVRLR